MHQQIDGGRATPSRGKNMGSEDLKHTYIETNQNSRSN
jgi:hypothetical protein